jgi:hypothetical protein
MWGEVALRISSWYILVLKILTYTFVFTIRLLACNFANSIWEISGNAIFQCCVLVPALSKWVLILFRNDLIYWSDNYVFSHVWVTIDWVCIRFFDSFQFVTIINSGAINIVHTLQFTTTCTWYSQSAVSSPVIWWRLPTADVSLPLGSWTVPMPQQQRFSANSSTATAFSRRLTVHWIPVCHSRRLSLHNSNCPKVKVKVTLRPTYESASPSWRQAPIWDPRPN